MLQSLLGPASGELVVDVPQNLPLESVTRRCLERLSFALALLDACYLLMPKKLAEATANPVGKSLRKTRWRLTVLCGPRRKFAATQRLLAAAY